MANNSETVDALASIPAASPPAARSRSLLSDRTRRNPLLLKLIRYASVGGLVALVYNGVVVLLTSGAAVSPIIAAAMAFAISLPCSYTGHRIFTFGSHRPVPPELSQFALVAVSSLCIATFSMFLAVDMLELPALGGALFANLLVPWVNFVVLNTKVFVPPRPLVRR